MGKEKYNQFLGKLNLNIGILKLKESRFKKLGKLQVNVFNFALERTSDDIGYNGKAFFNKYIFDVLVLKYNILKGLSLSLHLFKFEMRYNLLKKQKDVVVNMNPMPIIINQEGETSQKESTAPPVVQVPPMRIVRTMVLEPVLNFYWLPSLEIKFDVAKYLLAKKKK